MTPEQRPPRQPFVLPGRAELLTSDMTAVFSADLTLAEAQALLEPSEHWLAIDGEPDVPLRRLIETNSTGPLRLGFGAWRDLLLGVQFENGHGELISAGGRTMKNVAGYDLTKFMVGSHGVFGRLITITVRTYHRPAGAVVGLFPSDVSIVNKLLPTSLKPQWMLLEPGKIWCGYLAEGHALEFYASRLSDSGAAEVRRRSLEEDVAHRRSLWNAGGLATKHFRASLPPTKVADFVDAGGIESWAADPAFGIVKGLMAAGIEPQILRDRAATLGGSAIFLEQNGDATGAQTGPRFDLSTNPGERQIIERLKQAFDPDGRLTPLPWRTV